MEKLGHELNEICEILGKRNATKVEIGETQLKKEPKNEDEKKNRKKYFM